MEGSARTKRRAGVNPPLNPATSRSLSPLEKAERRPEDWGEAYLLEHAPSLAA
jgi:hypothetical protein